MLIHCFLNFGREATAQYTKVFFTRSFGSFILFVVFNNREIVPVSIPKNQVHDF